MTKIVLVRHGKPDFNTSMWIDGLSFSDALTKYRESSVTSRPKDGFVFSDEVNTGYFISSELQRAKDSLMLFTGEEAVTSAFLNEAELPHPDKLLFPFRWSTLIVICRMGWLLGYRSNAPGIRSDKERARKASQLLIRLASQHGSVFVFGHGVMNRLISSELKKQGWFIQLKTGDGYWGSTTLQLKEQP